MVRHAGAWVLLGPDFTEAEVIASYVDGTAVVAGDGSEGFPVMRIDPAQNDPLWLREIPGVPTGSPSSFLPPRLALLQDGDPVVAVDDEIGIHVHRFDAGAGATVWQILVADTHFGWPRGVAVDASGDVFVAAAAVLDSVGEPAFLVVKLDGDDGAELWRYVIPELGVDDVRADAVEPLPSGDVLAAGFAGGDVHVVKLAGADGTELWHYTTPTPQPDGLGADYSALVAAPGGDAFVAMTGSRLEVLRIDGTDGTETWRYETAETSAEFPTVAIAPDGDVVASGGYRLVKLAAADGSQIWNIQMGSGARPLVNEEGDVLIHYGGRIAKHEAATGALLAGETFVPPIGDMFTVPFGAHIDDWAGFVGLQVVGVGQVNWNSPGRAFAAVAFGDRLSGVKLLIKDPGDPSVRRFRLVSKDRAFMTPAPEDASAPTAAGATLEISNPVSGELASIPLPAAGWTVRPPSTIGGTLYKYLDRALANGPCKVVVLKGNRVLKAKCDGAQLAFTLDEATQGTIDVRLVLAGGFARCLSFGGPVRDEPGTFIAKNAPAPATCAGGL
jgi:outer membrane protein assembly factor BamB